MGGRGFAWLTAAWVVSYLALGVLHLVGWYKRYGLAKEAQRRGIRAGTIGSPATIYIDLDDPRCPERIRREYLEVKRRDKAIIATALVITAVLLVARTIGFR